MARLLAVFSFAPNASSRAATSPSIWAIVSSRRCAMSFWALTSASRVRRCSSEVFRRVCSSRAKARTSSWCPASASRIFLRKWDWISCSRSSAPAPAPSPKTPSLPLSIASYPCSRSAIWAISASFT